MAEHKPSKIKQGWRDTGTGKPAGKTPTSKRKQLFTVLTVLLAVAGATLAWLLLVQPAHEPYFLPLCITEYKDRHIPVNAQANLDRKSFADGKYFPDKAKNAFASQERKLLREELEHLKTRKAHEAVVLYLSAHILADSKGDLYLLPGDATPDEPSSWLALHELLEDLKACPSREKLLVLDVMRPFADPRLGVLANDSAARVEEALKLVDDPERLVLCACAPGQVSLTSEELGQSVFGYYLEEGLRGWADGVAHGVVDGKPDGRVSAQELARFVRFRVDRWAQRNRNARQTPTLYGASALDFNLVVLERGEARPPDEMAPLAEYPAWLRQAWQVRDQWWLNQTYRLSPRAYRQLEATVLRAEQHWRGGVEAEKVQTELKNDMANLQRQVDAARAALPRVEPRSLALAAALAKRPEASTTRELKELLLKLETIALSLKPDEAAAAKLKLREEFLAKFKGKPPFELAWRVFEVAADLTTPRPDDINFLYSLLSREQPIPLYVETLFLRRLDELASRLKKEGKDWPLEAARRALQVVREGERAVASDPRALPWVRDLLESAAQKRHDGEFLLFAPGFASIEQATKLLNEAVSEFQPLHSYLETVEEACRSHDEALALLPGIAPYLTNLPDTDVRFENAWKDAVGLLGELSGLLTRPPAEAKTPVPDSEVRKKIDLLQHKTEALRAQLRLLKRPFTDELPTLLAQAKRVDAGPVQVLEVDLVLETPCLNAKERVELWRAARNAARMLNEKTLALDGENPAQQYQLSIADFDGPRAQRREQERAARRAQVALDLLKLGGLAETDALETQLAQASRPPVAPAALPALAHELRQAWATRLGKQLQSEPSPRARDLLVRVVHPFDDAGTPADADSNPSVRLQRQLLLAQYLWLGDHFRYERLEQLSLADKRDISVDFYEDAAREYLKDVTEAPTTPVAQLRGGSEPPNLREGSREARYTINLSLTASSQAAVSKEIQAMTPDSDWLKVALPEGLKLEGNGPFAVPLAIELKPGAESSSSSPPLGFLVAASVNGRTFHHKVVTLLPGSTAKQPQVLISKNPKEPPAGASGDLTVRPNARQAMYVFVRNPGDLPKKMLVELKAEGHPGDGARSEPVEVAPRETKRIAFAKGPAAGDKAPDLPELKGSLQLRLLDVDNKFAILDRKDVAVSVGSPRDYVQITQAPMYRPAERKLSVKLKARDVPPGLPCRVKLVLPRDRIAGFIKAETGTSEGDLPTGGEELLLTAEGLQFLDNRTDENGYIYLTVDGYERAFVFRTTFAPQGTVPAAIEVFAPALRMQTARWARSDTTFRTRLEVDNAPSGVFLDVLLDRANNNDFVREARLVGDRRQRVGFTPQGPDGALLFQTAVDDWTVDLDTRGITGPRGLRVNLIDKNGRTILTDTKTIVLDDSPPEGARIVRVGDKNIPPKEEGAAPVPIVRATLLTIRAQASDRESGIHDVFFFFGKPVDGKVPPNTQPVRGDPLDDNKTTWSVRLPLPADRKGLTDITAQFVNGVGLSTFDSAAVEVTEPVPAGTAAKGPGKIQGTVVEGNRNQPNLEVVLLDDKGMVKAKKTTKADGSFLFEEVPPGIYKVTSSKAVSQTKGESPVTVEADKIASVKIELFR